MVSHVGALSHVGMAPALAVLWGMLRPFGPHREDSTMPTGLVLIGAILVVLVGILIFVLIRRLKPPEPPHFG